MTSLDIGKSVARNFGGSWGHRRRIIYGTLVFCAFCILYLMFKGKDSSELHNTIASTAFLLAGGVIGSYVFGAVWEDKGLAVTPTVQPQVNSAAVVEGTDQVDDPDKT